MGPHPRFSPTVETRARLGRTCFRRGHQSPQASARLHQNRIESTMFFPDAEASPSHLALRRALGRARARGFLSEATRSETEKVWCPLKLYRGGDTGDDWGLDKDAIGHTLVKLRQLPMNRATALFFHAASGGEDDGSELIKQRSERRKPAAVGPSCS